MEKHTPTSNFLQVDATKTLLSELFTIGIQLQALSCSLHLRQRLCQLADQLEPLLVVTTDDDAAEFDAEREEVRSKLLLICSEVNRSHREQVFEVEHNKSQIASQVMSKTLLLSELMVERNSIQNQTTLVQDRLATIRKMSSTDEENAQTSSSETFKQTISAEFFRLRKSLSSLDRKIRIITFFGLDVLETLDEVG